MKKVILTLGISFLCLTSFAQQTGPQSLEYLEMSPAGNKILKFVNQVNSGKSATKGWAEEVFAPSLIAKLGTDDLIGFIKDIQTNDGKLAIYEVMRPKVEEYHVKLKGSKNNGWLDMVVTFEGDMPYRITGFTVDGSEKPAKASKPMYPKGK